MPKALIALLAAAALVAAAAVPALGASSNERRTLLAALSGAEEVDNPGQPDVGGDPDGVGAAFVTHRRGRTLCFRIVARNVGDAVAAHIHRGRRGTNGPIVVGLFDDARGNGDFTRRARCLRAASRRLVRQIVRRPGGFYVNLHTAEFPNGAVRGQLSR